jgi:DNA-binding transcriptional MerR regulator
MNDNANYILELLRSGMSVDDIAKQMTDALNEASIAHKAEEEAKREAEEKAKLAEAEATKREEKREYLAAEVARTMKDYLDEFYPNLGSALDPKEFADSFIKSVEAIVEFKSKLEKLTSELDPDDLNWLDDFLK